MKKGNKEATIQRKSGTLKSLKGSPEEVIKEVLSKNWFGENRMPLMWYVNIQSF